MTQIITTIIISILPLILYVLFGTALARLCHFEKAHADAVTKLVYYLLLPASLFTTAFTADLNTRGLFFATALSCVLVTLSCVLSVFVARRVEQERKKRATLASILWKGNYTMLGLPVAAVLLSAEGYVIYAMIAVVMSILTNIIIIPQLTLMLQQGQKDGMQKALKDVATNPATLGAVLGLLVRLVTPSLPAIIMTPLNGLTACSGVVSMIMIGISIGVNGLSKNRRLIAVTGLFKLALFPLLFALAGYLAGIRGPGLGALVLSAAVPPGINAGILAGAMGADGPFANEAVFAVTVLSAASLFVWGVVFQFLGWL